MQTSFVIALFWLIGAGAASAVAAEVTYQRNADLPAMHLSYPELQRVIDEAAKLVAQANAGVKATGYMGVPGLSPFSESVKIESGSSSVTISGHRFSNGELSLPAKAEKFDYEFSSQVTAPITQVSLDLSGYERQLTITGYDTGQVDAVFSALKEKLADFSVPVGGSMVKGLIAYAAFIFLLFIAIYAILDIVIKKKREALWRILACIIVAVFVFWSPLLDVFVGFYIVSGDASFLVRNGPIISLLGLLASIAFPLIQSIRARQRQQSANALSSSSDSPREPPSEPSEERDQE